MTATAALLDPARTRARTAARAQSRAVAVAPWPRPVVAPAPRRLRAAPPLSRRARRRRRTRLTGWAIALTLFTVVAFHVVLAQNQLAIDRLERQTKAAEQRYEDARLTRAQQADPEVILQRAQALGLVPPTQPPVAVPIQGEVPAPPDDTSSTLHGWTDVKSTLGP